MPKNDRRPITFPFVDITPPFATKTDSRLEAVHSIRTYVYAFNFEADARPPGGSFLAPVQLRRLDYDDVRKWGRGGESAVHFSKLSSFA